VCTVSGKSLNLAYDPSIAPAPEILLALCNEIEHRLESCQGQIAELHKIFDAFKVSKTYLWDQLSTTLALNPSSLRSLIREWTLEDIASCVRRYVRELPEPLIPTNLYEDFIHVGKLQIDSDALLMMDKLIVNSLNLHHSRCVQFFGLHLAKICRIVEKWGNNGNSHVDAEKILSNFYGMVFLRPPWENVM